MSCSEWLSRVSNSWKSPPLFSVQHGKKTTKPDQALLSNISPSPLFSIACCHRYGHCVGVSPRALPSFRSESFCRYQREVSRLYDSPSSGHRTRRLPLSSRQGFSSFLGGRGGGGGTRDETKTTGWAGSWKAGPRRPSGTKVEQEGEGCVEHEVQPSSPPVDRREEEEEEEEDVSASWTSSFYSRSWLKEKGQQDVRIIPSPSEIPHSSSRRGPVPTTTCSSVASSTDSAGRSAETSFSGHPTARRHDDVCTLRGAHCLSDFSSAASRSFPGQKYGNDTLIFQGRDTDASGSTYAADSCSVPSNGQQQCSSSAAANTKPSHIGETALSEVSHATYAEVYIHQICTAPLTEQEEHTLSLVWRDLLNEKKLCHYLQKRWNVPFLLLRSPRFHHECIQYLKDNITGDQPPRTVTKPSSSSSLPSSSFDRAALAESSPAVLGRTSSRKKKRVFTNSAKCLSLHDPYCFPTPSRHPVSGNQTEEKTPPYFDRSEEIPCNSRDVCSRGSSGGERPLREDDKNVLNGRRGNKGNGQYMTEGQEQEEEGQHELSSSFRLGQCRFLLKQLRSVASGCFPSLDTFWKKRPHLQPSSEGVCTPEDETTLPSADSLEKARTGKTSGICTEDEQRKSPSSCYSLHSENGVQDTQHRDLCNETYTLLRSVSGGGGDEEEGRQQRKDGEGEGARSVLDQDSSRVVPQLLSPSDASRYAPLLALARLVLSDRYADYLLILRNLRRYANLRAPPSFYPTARHFSRQVYLHAGPPNSGKTAEAVKALLGASTGCYLAPLRLLAWEVYTRLKQEGKKVSLITGQERRVCKGQTHVCCTIEAAPLHQRFACGVIDEAQIISSSQRGDAWTRALLGLQVKELHLCTDERAIPVLERIVHSCNDILALRRYQRLSPLCVDDRPLENLEQLETGDCLVCFTRNDVLSLKGKLESLGYNVCLVYGQLPPRVKQAQARRFNAAVQEEYQAEHPQVGGEKRGRSDEEEETCGWGEGGGKTRQLVGIQLEGDGRNLRDETRYPSGQQERKTPEEGVAGRTRRRNPERAKAEDEDDNSTGDRRSGEYLTPTMRHRLSDERIDLEKQRETASPMSSRPSSSSSTTGVRALSSSTSTVVELRDLLTTHIAAPVLQEFLPAPSPSSSSLQHVRKQKTVLISTDAVGLGLNLDIRRVVFWKLYKFAGNSEGALRPLTVPEIRQLAGRAGRRGRVCGLEGGRVTCFSARAAGDEDDEDFKRIKEAIAGSDPLPPLKAAALLPSVPQLLLFCDELKRLCTLSEERGGGLVPFARSPDCRRGTSHVFYVEAFKMFCELAEIDEGYFLPRHKLNVMLTAVHALSDLAMSGDLLLTFALAPLPLSAPIAFLKESRTPSQTRKKNTDTPGSPGSHSAEEALTNREEASLRGIERAGGQKEEMKASEGASGQENEEEEQHSEPWEACDVELEEDHEGEDSGLSLSNGVATALGSGMTDSFLRAFRTFGLLLGTCGFVPLPREYVLGEVRTEGGGLDTGDSSERSEREEEAQPQSARSVYPERNKDDRVEAEEEESKERRKLRGWGGTEKRDTATSSKHVRKRVVEAGEGQGDGSDLFQDGELKESRTASMTAETILPPPYGTSSVGSVSSQQGSWRVLPQVDSNPKDSGEEQKEGSWSLSFHNVPALFSSVVEKEEENDGMERFVKQVVEYLTQLEECYQVLDLYRWLSMKYPKAFVDIQLAIKSQTHVANLIDVCLSTPWEKLAESGTPEQFRALYPDSFTGTEREAQFSSSEPRRKEVLSPRRGAEEILTSSDGGFNSGQVYRHPTGTPEGREGRPSTREGPGQYDTCIVVGPPSDAGACKPTASFDTSRRSSERGAKDAYASLQSHFGAFLAALNDSRDLFEGAVNPEKAFSHAVRTILEDQQFGEDTGCGGVLDCAYTTVLPGQANKENGTRTETGGRLCGETPLRPASCTTTVTTASSERQDGGEQMEAPVGLHFEEGIRTVVHRMSCGHQAGVTRHPASYEREKTSLPAERGDVEEQTAFLKKEDSMQVVLNDLREVARNHSKVEQILKQMWIACHSLPRTKWSSAEKSGRGFCSAGSPEKG